MKALALAAVTILALAVPAVAQPPPAAAMSPGFSPYLNLANRGNPAINYYGLVRPQFAFQNAIVGLQRQQQSLGESADPTDPTLRRGTGHPVHFNNLSHYYYNDPSRAGGARFGTGGAVRTGSGVSRPPSGVGQPPIGTGPQPIR